jgi:hypothetical protein
MSDEIIWRDVSDEIETKNGKANPFGWSQYEVHHRGKRIGWLESGYPMDFLSDYKFEVKEIAPNTDKLFVSEGHLKEDWDAIDFMKGYRPVGDA